MAPLTAALPPPPTIPGWAAPRDVVSPAQIHPLGAIGPTVNATDVLFNNTTVAGNFRAADASGPAGGVFDSGHSELFIADMDSSEVSVVSTANDTVVANIPVRSGPTGVAYDAARGEVFVTDQSNGTVSVINDTNDTVVATVRVGTGPFGIAIDPTSGDLFVANYQSNNVSVIADSNNTVVRWIALPPNPYVGDRPTDVVYDSKDGEMFVSSYFLYQLNGINTTTLRQNVNISTGGAAPYELAWDGAKDDLVAGNPYSNNVTVYSAATPYHFLASIQVSVPAGISYDPAQGEVLITAYLNRVELVNDTSWTVVQTEDAAGEYPSSITYDPATHRSFVSCTSSQSLTELSVSNGVSNVIELGFSPDSIAYDAGASALYVIDLGLNRLLVVSSASGDLLTQVPLGNGVGNGAESLAYDSGRGEVFAAEYFAKNVSVVSDATNRLTATIHLPEDPVAVAYDPANGQVFVAMGGNVTAISDTNNSVVATIRVIGQPSGLAYDPNTAEVYVANSGSNNVSVINASSDSLVGQILVNQGTNTVGVDPALGTVFATGEGNLTAIADVSRTVIRTVPVGLLYSYQADLVVDPSHGTVFVTQPGANTVTVLSATNESLLGNLSVGAYDLSDAYDYGNGLVYVPNEDQGTLSEIGTGPRQLYNVTLAETGLPSGTNWTASVGGTLGRSNGSSMNISEADGFYGITVPRLASYLGTPSAPTVLVNGTNVTVAVSFIFLSIRNVTFVEQGLPTGTTWKVTFNGSAQSGTGTSLRYSATYGSYAYTLSQVTGYQASPSSGTVVVSNHDVNVTIVFTPIPYTITFRESGLFASLPWNVTLNGTELSTTTSSLVFPAIEGRYPYAVGAETGFDPSPAMGNVSVTGGNATVSVVFHPLLYEVNVSENGLPGLANWGMVLNGTAAEGSSPSFDYLVPDGNYSYSIDPLTGYLISPDSGWVLVHGSDENFSVNFTPILYPVQFEEVGLPQETPWSVSLNGTRLSGATATISTQVIDGPYTFLVGALVGFSVNRTGGAFVVYGAGVNVTLTFTAIFYTVSFEETGLTPGTLWSVSFNGTRSYSSGPDVTFTVVDGTYAYSIPSTSGFSAQPSSGSESVVGSNATVSVVFTKAPPPRYNVTFRESGLPLGTPWSITLNGSQSMTSGTTLSFNEPNGTYPYTVGIVGGYTPSLSSGQVHVIGAVPPVQIQFASTPPAKFEVTFTEEGLTMGTTWSITLNGATQQGSGTTISFTESDGNYSYSVGSVTGYNASIQGGTIPVEGAPAGVTVQFTPVHLGQGGASGSSGVPPWILGAVAGAAAVGLVLGLLWARSRKSAAQPEDYTSEGIQADEETEPSGFDQGPPEN